MSLSNLNLKTFRIIFFLFLCSSASFLKAGGTTGIITGVSINGATASGTAGTWNVKWYASTDTTKTFIQPVTLTLSGMTSGDQIFMNAANTSSTWQMQFGSTSSNAWKTFCYDKVVGAVSTYTIWIRNKNGTAGTYTNTITIGTGACGSAASVTLNVTVEVVNAGVYTWIGTSGVDSTYGRALNWAPTRTSPATSDVLVVDLGSASSPVSTTIDISGVTETIGQFKIFPYNTVDFKCTTNNAVWTIGNSPSINGDDFSVSANSVMRKVGGAQLKINVTS